MLGANALYGTYVIYDTIKAGFTTQRPPTSQDNLRDLGKEDPGKTLTPRLSPIFQ